MPLNISAQGSRNDPEHTETPESLSRQLENDFVSVTDNAPPTDSPAALKSSHV